MAPLTCNDPDEPQDPLEDYLSKIQTPMDLTLVENDLKRGAILDTDSFLEKVLLVFQNAVTYNGSKETSYAKKLTSRCRHLVEYTKWLAMEMLPLRDDSNVENPEKLGDLRESLRVESRQQRMDILKVPYRSFVNPKNLGGLGVDINDCNKLLKDLEKRTTWGGAKRDRKQPDRLLLSFFTTPVNLKVLSDYSIYVRKPMDLSTVRAKLESIPPKYVCYHEFVDDVKLIFSNAITYNRIHENTDTTGVSANVLNAALHFQIKLDFLLNHDFSIDLCDRIRKDDLLSTDRRKEEVDTCWIYHCIRVLC